MKCPHCQYEHKESQWDSNLGDYTERVGYYPFFESPVKMEQKLEYGDTQRKTLYACPECGKAFIEV